MRRRHVQSRQRAVQDETRDRSVEEDPIEVLIRRAKRQLRRGDARGATVLLRRACSMDEWRARTFTLLGALLTDVGKNEEAERAFLHARWLRQRAGELSRAEVTAQLIDRIRTSRNAS